MGNADQPIKTAVISPVAIARSTTSGAQNFQSLEPQPGLALGQPHNCYREIWWPLPSTGGTCRPRRSRSLAGD